MSDVVERVKLTECCLRRLWRRGACVVLEAEAVTPRIETEGEGGQAAAVQRFNQAYCAMAEAFFSWAEGEPLAAAEADFEAAGAGAAYRFDRRILLFRVIPAPRSETDAAERSAAEKSVAEKSAAARRLILERTIVSTTRRGTTASCRAVGRDVWRLPSLTLCRPKNHRSSGCKTTDERGAR